MQKELVEFNLIYKDNRSGKGFFLSDVAIVLFVLYILTQGWLLSLILETSVSQIALLFFIIFPLMLKTIKERVFKLTRIDIFWTIAIITTLTYIILIGIAENDIQIFTYIFGLLFLLFTKVDIKRFERPISIIKMMSVVFALTTLFHYFFTDLFHSIIFPFISNTAQQRMNELVAIGYYPGLGLSQPSMAAAPIVIGIGAILSSIELKNNSKIRVDYILLFIFIISLIMIGKRSILIWVVFAALFTYYIAGSLKDKFKRVVKLVIGFLLILFLFFIGFNYFDSVPFLSRTVETINGLINGEDVTSGRLVLYERAWEIFKENPIFGIGWGQFLVVTSGKLLSRDLSVHNVYLQLLSETGLVGFILIMIPFLYVYYRTFKIVKKMVEYKFNSSLWKKGIIFSFYYQTFFLLYCLTENPFYNIVYMMMYFFSISIVNSFIIYKNLLSRKFKEN